MHTLAIIYLALWATIVILAFGDGEHSGIYKLVSVLSSFVALGLAGTVALS